ncbi:hypothetical protein HispidOSU_028331 [Sigmodon hispidus]
MKDPGSSAGDTPSRRGDQSSLSGSGAQDSGFVTETSEHNASVLNGPDCSGIPQGCEGTDDEGALVEKATLVEMPPHDPEQEEESEESQFMEFGLTVPFLSFMDAEVARLYLAQEEESLEGAVHRELRVTGSDLIIRVTSENSSLLHSSVSSLLSQLSTVVTALRFFVPEFFNPHQE